MRIITFVCSCALPNTNIFIKVSGCSLFIFFFLSFINIMKEMLVVLLCTLLLLKYCDEKAKCSYYCKVYASLLYWGASYSDCIISYVPIEITTGTTLREKN